MTRLRSLLYVSGCAMILATAVGFIAYDLARKSGWSWLDAFTGISSAGTRQGDIRKYVEFVTTKHKTLPLKIITGIRFDDSTNRAIDAQWCYAEPIRLEAGGLAYRLDLVDAKANGLVTAKTFSAQALSQFHLSQDQARALITYCRFRKPRA